MAHKSPSSNAYQQHDDVEGRRRRKHDHEVHLITGASESVVADSERKNGIYAILIGVRILSLFLVLLAHGWLQIVIFVVGMLAPWIGVQIANNIRQVDDRSIQTVPPQQAALTVAQQQADDTNSQTVIVGDYVVHDDNDFTSTPSAESEEDDIYLSEHEKDDDDTRS